MLIYDDPFDPIDEILSLHGSPDEQSNTDTSDEEPDHEELAALNEAKAFIYDILKAKIEISTNKQLNNYILENKKLKQFPHLIGNLEMSDDSNEWTYKGGISPRWYKFICEELKIQKGRSQAKPVRFTSYSEFLKRDSKKDVFAKSRRQQFLSTTDDDIPF